MKALVPMVAAALLLAAPFALAGRSCEEAPLPLEEVTTTMKLAQRTLKALDDSGAAVAMISRAGQDLSKYGLVYSHMAFAVRDHAEGRWTVVHELNDCGTAGSDLWHEGIGNFLLIGLHRHATHVLVPGPDVQARLVALLGTRTPRRLHEPRYSMLAYAFSTRYQNSNQWVLETLAAATAPPGKVETRAEAQQWLKGAGFAPLTIEVPMFTRLGGRMFRANVMFDDHPFDRRMAGQIDTITTDAIVRFVRASDSAARVFVVD
ncbi:DUF2145 domain-containing protein [Pseudoduganella albidiflava]|uniref:DUF2145 domain-containing protein n=1 Tax=Pseudoduganella albidiflava TaxID=321983 RepID=A0A411WT77_9BURK|nr:DUF2145 domain-containing protein [Pseudoduganella albidiflava]QBH99696.1 DUF2145 domain-containing protein [Pseudoduganella albidiflava]GGY46925.1 membrane protein [Pseudoduganella albidiflava]